MRLLCEFENSGNGPKTADRFQRFLASKKIETERRDEESTIELWVLDEDKMFEAKLLQADFSKDPENSKFSSSSRLSTDHIPGKSPAQFTAGNGRGRIINVKSEIFGRPRNFIVTLGIITISVVLTLMSMSDRYDSFLYYLYYSEYNLRSFPEITDGQVWRLFTPIFLHSGIFHLGFNMYWVWLLGGQIEGIQGSRFLLFFVLVFAALCNTSQYLMSGPLFVGISGVVYALLGYIWMMSRFEAAGRYNIEPQTIVIMVIWLVICAVGIIKGVANTQHIVGFLGGTAFGYIYSGGLKSEIRRRRYRKSLRP
jgi:GlpG protein